MRWGDDEHSLYFVYTPEDHVVVQASQPDHICYILIGVSILHWNCIIVQIDKSFSAGSKLVWKLTNRFSWSSDSCRGGRWTVFQSSSSHKDIWRVFWGTDLTLSIPDSIFISRSTLMLLDIINSLAWYQ